MKLLNELIETLSSEKPSLTDALMKTKVLLHKVGRKDLAEWVNLELNGDPQDAVLPEYRVLSANVHGNASNAAYNFTGHALPTFHLKPDMRKGFEELDMRESIAAVEKLAGGKSFRRDLPPEAYHLFDEVLVPGTHVTSAWCEIGSGAVINILTQVRSRLLDFLLDLQGKVGDNMTEEEVKKVAQSPETGSSFSQSIYGNNNTILVGNHNTQTVIHVKAGDFGSLAKVLGEHGVDAPDIAQLKVAIKEDTNSHALKTKKGFGNSVKNLRRGRGSNPSDDARSRVRHPRSESHPPSSG